MPDYHFFVNVSVLYESRLHIFHLQIKKDVLLF